jgi:hypothetical protein
MARSNDHAVFSLPHHYGPQTAAHQKFDEPPIISVIQLSAQEKKFNPAVEIARQRPQSPSFLLSSKKVVFSERDKSGTESKSISPSLQDAKFGSHTGNVVIQDALAAGSMQDWWQSLMAKSGRTTIDNTMARPIFDAWFRQCVLCTDMEKPLAWAKSTCTKVIGGVNNAVFHTTCTMDNFSECLTLLAHSQLVADAFKGTDIVMSHFVVSLRRMTEVDMTFQSKSIISMPWWNKVKSMQYSPPSSAPWNNVKPSRSAYFDSSNSTNFALSTEWSVKSSHGMSDTVTPRKGDNSFILPSKILFQNPSFHDKTPDASVMSNVSEIELGPSSAKSTTSILSQELGQNTEENKAWSRPGSAPASRSLHVGLPGSGTAQQPTSPYSRGSSHTPQKQVFEMGGTKLQTPVGKVTSRRFVADSLMKSYKENAAALVSHSKLRQVSKSAEEKNPGENVVQAKIASASIPTAKTSPTEGKP